MKAILIATGMSIIYIVAAAMAFRLLRANVRTAAFLNRLFLLTLLAAIGIYYLTPRDLGFLPGSMIENPVLEVIFLLFIYNSAYFAGILQVYELADRGFSLRISIDIDKSGGCMTVPEVMQSYSMGKGTRWMYQKRIDGLLAMKLIETRGERIVVTLSGERLAASMSRLRRFLGLDKT